jgi:hypothetical protein
MFTLRPAAVFCIAILTTLLSLLRLWDVILQVGQGNPAPLLTFPLGVIFPIVLIAILLLLSPAATHEGALMRAGTMIQLLLIIGLPVYALYLALGMPVVFLAVELFETRLPAGIRKPLTRLVLA